MKKIKIILGVISFFVVVFFLTGLFVKKTSYKTQVSINKPIENVFETFTDISNRKYWIPELHSYEVVNQNPGKTGSVYKLVVQNQGQEIISTEKVMAYIKNQKFTLYYTAQNMLKRDDYVFNQKEGMTQIILNSSCQSDSYIMACIFPYFKGTFQKQDQIYLNNFKAFLEK